MSADPASPHDDPVLRRRAAIARWCATGRRVGYGLYGAAVVLFFVGLAVGYRTWMTSAIIGAMVLGGVILVPAIVFGYGVRAAEREDRGEPFRY